jgi:hypothetical protein
LPVTAWELLLTDRHAIRAPREDGAVVSAPPLQEAGALLAANAQRGQAARRAVLGRPWLSVRQQARRDAVAAACRYLRERGEPLPGGCGQDAPPTLLFVAGHQPELFHPGVWVKNFALQGLARRHGGLALNLIVDNDTVKTTAVRLPARARRADARSTVELHTVPFDSWNGGGPWEEHAVVDAQLFDSFAERAGAFLRDWDYVPTLPAFWEEVTRQRERTRLVGECFAAARRSWERRWGCHNLEVPLSLVCNGEPFAWFACDLLAGLPGFQAVYNSAVQAYRKTYGIRSGHHPVPDLAREGDWLEAPLWAWRAGRQRRERLFVRRAGGRLELRAGKESWPDLPFPGEADPELSVAAWQELGRQGYKIRTRALTTTLYARLFLADLFMHGIGGGKYDELTDELIRRFYDCSPPEYLVLSGTRLLPLPQASVQPEDESRLAHVLRDLHFNPQRHWEAAPELDGRWRQLAAQKQEWIERRPPPGREGKPLRRERFAALRRLTAELEMPLRPRLEQVRQELQRCRRQLAGNALLERRDYVFCLYPESVLRPFCTQFLAGAD